MRQIVPRRALALGAFAAAVALLGAGPRKDNPLKKKETPPKVEETIGDIAVVQATGGIQVEGVGLVVGLDGTGSDPEPSLYREKLLAEMRKAIPNAEALLASDKRTMSLVLVRGKIPVGITTHDVFDIELQLTPASATESLQGGVLIRTVLKQVAYAKGRELDGQEMAVAFGPVMIGNDTQPDNPRVGRVLGGARVKKDLPYTLILNERRKGFRTIGLVERAINTRFHERQGSEQAVMATAKTDQYLVLRVPHVYHQNQGRYFQVVRRLPLVENSELRALRMKRWSGELLDPKTAEQAAIKLEGIGRNASGILKTALGSPDEQVRFFAAESLAYLNDETGVDILADAAVRIPKFRAFALAALAAMDQAAASIRLRSLMSQADPEVRYGAFNALRALDENDAFLGRVHVLDDPEPPADEAEESMALQIATTRRRKRRPDPFELYVVDTDGPPLIHVARTRRSEVVVFGKGQRLLTPAVLGGAGTIQINAADGDPRAQISRITGDGPDRKVASRLELGEVIRRMANLGATYPEILTVLQAAERQRNLPGPLIVDAIPAPDGSGKPSKASLATKSKKDAAVGRAGFESRPAGRRGILGRFFPRPDATRGR